ncbi:hypothetical protein [Nakamurella lactea]|uniref:hypothetical protein n=1 Tax=Nakamurella lactea TaxID=459515 RepID=UPI00042A664B|nr:hypothetical protein [Nakamurella lactea]
MSITVTATMGRIGAWLTEGQGAAVTPTPGDPNPNGGHISIPDISPNFDAPGVHGLTTLGGMVAAVVLVIAVLAILFGVLLAVFGPRLGFHGAKGLGMGGIIGGFTVGAVVAMATPGVETIYHWFA